MPEERKVSQQFDIFMPLSNLSVVDVSDLELVNRLSNGRVDLTYGRYVNWGFVITFSLTSLSSLDIFGGSLVKFHDLVEINKNALSVQSNA